MLINLKFCTNIYQLLKFDYIQLIFTTNLLIYLLLKLNIFRQHIFYFQLKLHITKFI